MTDWEIVGHSFGHLVLLNVFAKGDKIDLTKAERKELRKELLGLADDYGNGVRRHVQGW